ncbi:unnamed protein product [Ilex paraguariensis]|uniref:Uncharacterized protein n=1 Tax=Ilex paraguariensis TaxID=185542 RepID=A0ABC8QTK7_9AQUA
MGFCWPNPRDEEVSKYCGLVMPKTLYIYGKSFFRIDGPCLVNTKVKTANTYMAIPSQGLPCCFPYLLVY